MATIKLDLEVDIQPVSDFRSNAAAMMNQVRSSGRPIVLTQRGRGAAVLIDIARFQALIEELETLRDIQRARADVDAGRVMLHEEVRTVLRDRYKS